MSFYISDHNIKLHNKELKDFYLIEDFQKEILDWVYGDFEELKKKKNIVIGHPDNSHKGASIGDKIVYTSVPELIKKYHPDIKVYVYDDPVYRILFKHNKFIDGFSNQLEVYGSLGLFGNTIQRCCNVYCHGIRPEIISPNLYIKRKKRNSKKVLICTCSKTGGTINDITRLNLIVDALRDLGYSVTQLAASNDLLIRSVNDYIFNINNLDKLIETISNYDIYLGIPNSIYHISKSLNLQVYGILSDIVDTSIVHLPVLTVSNYLERKMLPLEQQKRAIEFEKKYKEYQDIFHHVGWLYPDIPHFTLNQKFIFNNPKIKFLTDDLIPLLLNNNIYPYNNPKLYDYYNYSNYFI